MIVQAINPWGRQDGLEPQRSDLWYLDLTQAFDGIMGLLRDNDIAEQVEYNGQSMNARQIAQKINPMGGDKKMLRYYALSVNMPELTVAPEVIRKDSRPYNVPGFDQPLPQIRVGFVNDISKFKDGMDGIRRSEIYAFLNLWRMIVRAGRGEMSSEYALALDKNFRVSYGFDVTVNFLGGVDISQALNESVGSGLEVTSVYVLKNCWLSSFGLGPELAFGEGRHCLLNSTFFADDIVANNELNGPAQLLDAGTPYQSTIDRNSNTA